MSSKLLQYPLCDPTELINILRRDFLCWMLVVHCTGTICSFYKHMLMWNAQHPVTVNEQTSITAQFVVPRIPRQIPFSIHSHAWFSIGIQWKSAEWQLHAVCHVRIQTQDHTHITAHHTFGNVYVFTLLIGNENQKAKYMIKYCLIADISFNHAFHSVTIL